MIIWSGFGFLVLVLVLACEFAAITLAATLTGNPDYSSLHGWVMGLGALAAAAGCWYLGTRLSGGGRVLVDPQTGQQVVFRRRDSLFFIPIRWRAVPLVLFAVGYSFRELTPAQLRQERAEEAIKAQARLEARGQR